MIFPIVLSGGAGTRLWPHSHSSYPKQFQTLGSEYSLLQDTARRTSNDELFAPPLIICNDPHRFLVAEHMCRISIPPKAIVLEPTGRNTTPAVAVAALMVAEQDPNGILLVMPSDHAISDNAGFLETVQTGYTAAVTGSMVAFGVPQTRADIGFGYINAGAALDDAQGFFVVDQFVEKPPVEVAEDYAHSGNHYWNAGIFMFSAQAYLDKLGKTEPDILTRCKAAIAGGKNDLEFFRLDEKAFTHAKAVSIDCAVLENTDQSVVVPSEFS